MSTSTTKPSQAFGGNGPRILIGGWVMCSLGIVLTALRLWAVSKRAGRLRWDFVWVSLAILCAVAAHATFTMAILYGIGNHIKYLTFPELFEALHWIWSTIFIGIFAAIFAKYAIIALLLEVQSPNAKKRRAGLLILAALLGIAGVIQLFLSLFKCNPVPKLWNPTLPGECPRNMISAHFSYFQGGLHAFADIFLSLFPITIVWNLQTSFRTKFGFCLLMAFGAVPSIAVIIRTVMLHRLSISKDPTWDFGTFMIWASTELWSVIIIGSIPPLRPLFLRLFSSVTTTINSTTRDQGTGFRTQQGQSQVGTGVRMTKLDRSNVDHKGGLVSAHATHIIDVERDGSTDDVLANDHLGGGIVVKTDVNVENVSGRSSDDSSQTTGPER